MLLLNQSLIMNALHLYNALRQCGYLDEGLKWEDAEYLISIHGDDTYLKDPPKTMEDCQRRITLYAGASAQTFATNRRRGGNRVILNKTGPKFLQEMTPVAEFFKERFLSDGDIDMSWDRIEKVVMASAKQRIRNPEIFAARKSGLVKVLDEIQKVVKVVKEVKEEEWEDVEDAIPEMADSIDASTDEDGDEDAKDDPELTPEALEALAEKMLNRYANKKTLSTGDFLEELVLALESETDDLNFDYFAFFRSTWRLLVSLQETCVPYLTKFCRDDQAKAILEHEDGVTLVPQALLSLAADPKKDHAMLNVKGSFFPLQVDTEGMKAAGEVMKEFIQREGDAFVKRMKDKELRQKEVRDDAGEGEDKERYLKGTAGAVGVIDGMTEEENLRKLRAVKVADVRKRWEEKEKKEKEREKLEEEARQRREEGKASKKVRQRRIGRRRRWLRRVWRERVSRWVERLW